MQWTRPCQLPGQLIPEAWGAAHQEPEGTLPHALRFLHIHSPFPTHQETAAGVEVTLHPSFPPYSQHHVQWPHFHSY